MILNSAPVEVTVWPVVDVDDGYGGVKPGEGEPFTLRAFAQPLQATGTSVGWADDCRFKLIFNLTDIGRWSRVEFDGEVFFVVDHPKRHTASPATMFATCVVSRQGSKGVSRGHAEPSLHQR